MPFMFGAHSYGTKIHSTEHHLHGGEVVISSCRDAEDFGTVTGDVAEIHRHPKAWDADEAAGSGHVVEARSGVKVVSAAGAPTNGGTATMVAAGQNVAAGADDRLHSFSVRRCWRVFEEKER